MPAYAYHGPHALQPLEPSWSWQQHANCRGADPNIFFHPEGERAPKREDRLRRAQQFCDTCPVRIECGEHALGFGEDFGIWGGLSEDERLRLHNRTRRRTRQTRKATAVAVESAPARHLPAPGEQSR